MRLIVDMDTGLDDALALLYLHRRPEIDIAAISCVNGCVPAPRVAANTAAVLAAAEYDVPTLGVTRCDATRRSWRPSEEAFGPTGMGSLALPQPSTVHLTDASTLIARTLMGSTTPTSVLCTGPLTNLSAALAEHPQIRERIGAVYVMGGSIAAGGNTTPSAEFNIFQDPEAADHVLQSGCPVVMYGLDVFTQPTVDPRDVARLRTAAAADARLAGTILAELLALFPGRGAFLGDAGFAVAITFAGFMKLERLPVRVELHGSHTRGATVVDRRPQNRVGQPAPGWPKADFSVDIDAPAISSEFVSTLLSERTNLR